MNTPTNVQYVQMRCDLCKTGMVQMHCDECHVHLCKVCVGEHLSADLSKSHTIVAIKDRNRIILYPHCPSHVNEQCEMYCNQCCTPMCTACIASGEHFGHSILQIRQIYEDKRKNLEEENKDIKQNLYPAYQGILSDVKNKMSQLDKIYGDLSTAITKHGETWHREIDMLVNKLRSEAVKMKQIHLNILEKHLQHIKGKIILLERILNSQEKVLDSSQLPVSLLLGYQSQIPKLSKLPAKIDTPMPCFTPVLPWNNQEEQFIKLFGKLSTLSFNSEEEPGHKMKALEQAPETEFSPLSKHLINDTETVNSINTGYGHLYNVACLGNEKIWTSGYDSVIRLFSMQGSFLKSIITKSGRGPHDIAVTKSGDLVYTDYRDKTVNIVKYDQIEEMIKLQNWKPLSLCSTSKGDLLVTMDSADNKQAKVVCYSDSTEKQTIQFDDEGNPLYFQNDKYINENQNLDICVAVNGAGVVVVVNQAGKLRFRYTGYTPAPKNKPFSPRGITTNSQSHILTADDNNCCIHIIDQDGQFLRYLPGLIDPWGLCTDANDNLFVAQRGNKEVKILRY
ncbi:E3 ubiquitin-protein ligase TRIM71-like [Saccostrea echinata]|uniref:E3 ubiquitin-protein ligase TRIM71-like n=1 Tax=Saccostrea echinata TaxID=191078 RepID=UPI002A7ED833|nr:E3 ubiquitin-protein ligase TRIM71-like [Saccostrea echinata]